MTLLRSLIKHKHKPVAIAKTWHVVHGVESTRVIEDVLDPGECVQYLWHSARHGARVRVSISNLLLGQAFLHFLGSEEGKAAVNRVLWDQLLNICLDENQPKIIYERIVTREMTHQKLGHSIMRNVNKQLIWGSYHHSYICLQNRHCKGHIEYLDIPK